MENQINFMGNNCKDASHFHSLRLFSWGGIVGGAFVAIGLSFLFNMFMMAVGLSIFSVDSEGLKSLAMGGFVGMLIGIIIVMFLSGMVAGYGAKACGRGSCVGALHGFVSWCLALLITVSLATALGNFMTNNFYAIAKSSKGLVSLGMNADSEIKDNVTQLFQRGKKHMKDITIPYRYRSGNADAARDQRTEANVSMNNNSDDDYVDTNNSVSDDNSQNVAATIGKTATKATHVAGGATFATFILFLAAALASLLGGYCGASCNKKEIIE